MIVFLAIMCGENCSHKKYLAIVTCKRNTCILIQEYFLFDICSVLELHVFVSLVYIFFICCIQVIFSFMFYCSEDINLKN